MTIKVTKGGNLNSRPNKEQHIDEGDFKGAKAPQPKLGKSDGTEKGGALNSRPNRSESTGSKRDPEVSKLGKYY